MKIHIISIFPESFKSYFDSSIIWKAREKSLFNIELYKLNDFSSKKFKHVDDKAYWMHWQVLSAEPLSKAIEFIYDKVWKKLRIIYMTPSWDLLNQEKVEKLYMQLDEFIIICGHYEWIDERIIELYNLEKISIWEYVLSSWELAASVLIDILVRHIPWVLWNKQSLEEDSFSIKFDRQKEYPVYTRPEEFMGKKVPKILLSWNHQNIEKWKEKNLVK